MSSPRPMSNSTIKLSHWGLGSLDQPSVRDGGSTTDKSIFASAAAGVWWGRLWIASNLPKVTGRADGVWAMETDGPARAPRRSSFPLSEWGSVVPARIHSGSQTLFVAIQPPGKSKDDQAPSCHTLAQRFNFGHATLQVETCEGVACALAPQHVVSPTQGILARCCLRTLAGPPVGPAALEPPASPHQPLR